MTEEVRSEIGMFLYNVEGAHHLVSLGNKIIPHIASLKANLFPLNK